MPIFSYTDHGRVGKRTAQPSEPRHPLHIIGHSIGCPFFCFYGAHRYTFQSELQAI